MKSCKLAQTSPRDNSVTYAVLNLDNDVENVADHNTTTPSFPAHLRKWEFRVDIVGKEGEKLPCMLSHAKTETFESRFWRKARHIDLTSCYRAQGDEHTALFNYQNKLDIAMELAWIEKFSDRKDEDPAYLGSDLFHTSLQGGYLSDSSSQAEGEGGWGLPEKKGKKPTPKRVMKRKREDKPGEKPARRAKTVKEGQAGKGTEKVRKLLIPPSDAAADAAAGTAAGGVVTQGDGSDEVTETLLFGSDTESAELLGGYELAHRGASLSDAEIENF